MTDFGEVAGCHFTDAAGMTTSIDPSPAPMPTARSGRGGSRLRRLTVRTAGLARPIAGTRWFRLWAVLHHVGRRSGRAFETPVVALPIAGGFLIPLPFGDETQWLKNLEAADRAGLRRGGHDYVIDRPEVVDLETAGADLPTPIRFASGRLGINHFVRVHQVDGR
jgi:deazaflavin-dependent oxidoreductase (nitroreductase family)